MRATLRAGGEIDVVAVNDLGQPEALARLLARDSVHGALRTPVEVRGEFVTAGDHRMQFLAVPEIEDLPWKELGVDVVIESTGRYTSRAAAAVHLQVGAQRVIVSAPVKDADITLVIGVNDEMFDSSRHFVISNASCTTNCLAVLAKVLDDTAGIEDGLMSTVHAYTGDQRLVDALHKDPRRSRAAATNIVPTTTGAARATGLVLPSVEGHLDGLAVRVPVPDGSLTDLVALVREPVSVEDINTAYERAATSGRLSGVLEYVDEPLVSSDIFGIVSIVCLRSRPHHGPRTAGESHGLVRQRNRICEPSRGPRHDGGIGNGGVIMASTTLADFELDPPTRVPEHATLRSVARIMADGRVSCVVVGTGSAIVTEHDLAGALASGLDPDSSVAEIATRIPVWATSSSTLADAVDMMVGRGVRHLLVLTPHGTVQGVVSLYQGRGRAP